MTLPTQRAALRGWTLLASGNCTREEYAHADMHQENESTTEPLVQDVELRLIQIDPGIQVRVGLNQTVVASYSKAMRQQAQFPPLIIYRSEGQLILCDGHHRHAAAQAAGIHTLQAIIKSGTRGECLMEAVRVNLRHGLRLSAADKQRVVISLLTTGSDFSDRALAKLVGVSDRTVGRLRSRLNLPNLDAKRRGSDGKLYRASQKKTNPASASPSTPAQVVTVADPGESDAMIQRLSAMHIAAEEFANAHPRFLVVLANALFGMHLEFLSRAATSGEH